MTHYFKLYFDIKVHHNLISGPYHVLESIKLANQQPEEIQSIIKPVIQNGAYHAHSESVLLFLLGSVDIDLRDKGVDANLAIRGEN